MFEQFAIIITIFVPIAVAVAWLTQLKSKVSQIDSTIKELKQDNKGYDKRLRELEIKLYSYNLIEYIR